MAEARSAVTEPRVGKLEECQDTKRDFLRAWKRAFFRRFFKTRNLIYNGMWPTSIWILGLTVSALYFLLITDCSVTQPLNALVWQFSELINLHKEIQPIPHNIRIFLISFSFGVVFFIVLLYIRRWTLRILLSYHGWMYAKPRTKSMKIVIWGLIVRLVSGYNPTTFSYQKSLPFLPVPKLHQTLKKLMSSLKPLLGETSEEYLKIKQQSKNFEKSLGPKFQRVLKLKSWWAENWLTDWWEKYVYLHGRTSIAINSNYYILDNSDWVPTNKPISRAAMVMNRFLKCKRLIDREELTTLLIRDTVPLCMAQYEKVFSSTRIPGVDADCLQRSSESKHVTVMHRGVYYKLEVFDAKNQILTPPNLEKQLQWIVNDAKLHEDEYCEGAKSLAALTAADRSEWAGIRNHYFSAGVNKDSITTVEKGIFNVILDTHGFDSWTDRAKQLLHSDGRSIWFDKSFNVMVNADGHFGVNVEHSWGDAPVMGHVIEFLLTDEILNALYDEDGFCKEDSSIQQAHMRMPERLVWEIPAALENKISQAVTLNIKNNDDLQLHVCEYAVYGKGFIKTCKVSPDAYLQLALQLAFFRDRGKFELTYEASMTRLYLLGRTETVRSLTTESTEFVRAMADKTKSNEERIKLLRIACDVHQEMYRTAMDGHAIDRHLFGLYVVSKGMGYDCEFLKNVLTLPWTLSTSQQPQQQIATSPDCNNPQYKNKISPGGGFGPVSEKGYGVSYMLPGDSKFFFHISSKKSCKLTDSLRLMNLLFQSLDDMKALYTAVNGK